MGFSNGGGGGSPGKTPFAFGTAAARPAAAAGNANTGYFATDTQEVSFSDGAAWHLINQVGDPAQNFLALKTIFGITGDPAGEADVWLGPTAAGLRFGGSPVQWQVAVAKVFAHLSDLSVDTAGKGLQVAEGANAKQGTAVLAGGTAVVANTSVTAASRIFLTCQALGTVAVPSGYGISARIPGVSFTILASAPTDTSTIAYEIFEPGTAAPL